MSSSKVFLSIDLGASSGRIQAGVWNGASLELQEVHRFPSPSVFIPPYHHGDFLGIYHSILQGSNKAQQAYGAQIVSIGCDAWGVDYSLLDARGEMLANPPIQYRDGRSQATIASVSQAIGGDALYAETGIQFVLFNTIFQLAAKKREGRDACLNARHLLFNSDLINDWLTGKMIQEHTVANSSQLLNPSTGRWSQKLIDVASAVAATPFASPRSAFLSSGTWSIMGRELARPNTSREAMKAGFSNELGYNGTVRFLRNICGMWLIEESRRQWIREGQTYTYDEMADMTCAVPARRAFIDPDAEEFATAGDLPTRIAGFCRRTGRRARCPRRSGADRGHLPRQNRRADHHSRCPPRPRRGPHRHPRVFPSPPLQAPAHRALGCRSPSLQPTSPMIQPTVTGKRVQMMITCLCDAFYADVAKATYQVLQYAGCTVDVPDGQTCCGQPAFNTGDWDSARRVLRHTEKTFAGDTPIVLASGSCSAMLRHAGELAFEHEADQDAFTQLGKRSWELTEFLVEGLGLATWGGRFKARVALHRSCHTRGSKAYESAVRLLSSIEGLELLQVGELEQCCGFGGTFCVSFPNVSKKMGQLKVEHLTANKPDVVASLDMACMMHFGGMMDRQRIPIRRMHVAEILAAAREGATS